MIQKNFLSLSFFILFYLPLQAQGDLLIFPKRVTFDGIQQRVKILNLSNIGKDTATYTLSYQEIRMGEEGTFNIIEVAEKDQNFASPYLRYYPRTITLAPNESQNVKIQLIKTNELKQGEYRSHLYFRAVPKVVLLKKEAIDSIATQSKDLSINLTPVFGLSIANIITIGENTTAVELTNLAITKSIKDNTATLSLNFNRQGNQSAYGTIEVNYVSTAGVVEKVATIRGFAIYTPNTLRKGKIELDSKKNIDYSEGQLQVSFTAEGQKIPYTKAVLNLSLKQTSPIIN